MLFTFLKRFILVVLCFILLCSVNLAPDRPVLFIILSLGLIISLRLLWLSLLRDERKMKRKYVIAKSKVKYCDGKNNLAA